MTTFDDREQAYENKFAHDAHLNFRAEVRCNKMLGLWAAEQLGKTGNEAEAYASGIIKADLDEASHDEVIASIASDLDGKASVAEVTAKRAEFLAIARKEVLEES
ncbi:aldolase [Salipiger sp. CCB-MM3]|uniref:DUF1476 domain-containing protein n=1 Tax=Roseobacteraceae TaxID=2854170 RepID=UPI00080A9C75|nr:MULTISPECIES: DUF1476 domain-containing protein [Roseobacteraceae]ANT59276.1 aldolase [Salipiger sp. CCB-MM3]MCA0996604.1 DUF1476 domain-containing protein [Alloyangia pacifica]